MQMRFERLSTRLLGAVLAVFTLLTAAPAGAYVVDRIAAIVNNDIILLSELNQAMAPYEQEIRSLSYPPAQKEQLRFETREKLLNQMINQKLTDQIIDQRRITISEMEIEEAVERFKQANHLSEEMLRERLAAQGMTYDDYRTMVRDQILRSRVVNMEVKSKIIITDEDVKAYYEAHQDQYGGQPAYHLRNILIPVSPDASAEDQKAAYEKIKAAHDQLVAGTPFVQVAKDYSQSSNAAEGGDLGTFELKVLSPTLQKEISQTAPGEFTDILETDPGYQIFFVEAESAAAGQSLADVSTEIKEKLYQEVVDEKFTSWIQELRQKSYIKVIR